jgi:hypothetical protein
VSWPYWILVGLIVWVVVSVAAAPLIGRLLKQRLRGQSEEVGHGSVEGR